MKTDRVWELLGCVFRRHWLLLGMMSLVAASVLAMVGYVRYETGVVQSWDKKIEALCAANGGADVATQVYETAVAPETNEYFRGTGPDWSFGVVERLKGETLGPQYPFVHETRVVEVLNQKDPSVVRYTERIVRVRDNKILGERFGYQRGGGGVQYLTPADKRNCPIDSMQRHLEVNVFENHPRRYELEKR